MNNVCCSKKGFKPSKFNTCRKGWIRVPISKCGIIIKNKVKRVSRKRWGSVVKPMVTRNTITPEKRLSRKKWGSVVKPMVTRRRKIKVLPKRPLKKRKIWSNTIPVMKVRKIRRLPRLPSIKSKN